MRFDLRTQVQLFLVAGLMVALSLALGAASADGNSKPQDEQSSAAKGINDSSVYAEIAKAPQKERAKMNPFEKKPDAILAGSKLFAQYCAECHGNMAEGGKKAPSLREKDMQAAPPGALFWLLTNGVVRRGMPVWSKLPEQQRWQIVSFLKSLHEE
jgi:mono/diheme cytochrome c family protein